MNRKLLYRRFMLICTILFLIILAWWAIAGGVRQFSHSNTVGQKIETLVQLICGILSLLTVLTIFRLRTWAKTIRLAWTVSLVITAALSSLVWGPPMPFVALAFTTVALLVATITLWSLKRLTSDEIYAAD